MKDQEDKKFENYIKDRFRDLESTPPAGGWENIYSQIQTVPVSPWRWLLPLAYASVFIFYITTDVSEKQNAFSSAHKLTAEKVKSDSGKKQSSLAEIFVTDAQKLSYNTIESKNLEAVQQDKMNELKLQKVPKAGGKQEKEEKKKYGYLTLTETDEATEIKEIEKLTTEVSTDKVNEDVTTQHLTVKPAHHFTENNDLVNAGQEQNIHTRENHTLNFLESMPLVIQSQSSRYHHKTLKKIAQGPVSWPKTKPLWIGFYISPVASYRRILPNQQDQKVITSFQNPGVLNTDNLGISLGITLEKALNERFLLYTQLNYTRFNAAFKYDYRDPAPLPENYVFSNVDPFGFEVSPVLRSQEIQSRYQSLNVQGGLKYAFYQAKLQQSVIIGLGYQRLIQSTTTVLDENALAPAAGQSNLMYLHTGYEFSFPVTLRLRINVMPSLSYYFQSFYDKKAAFEFKPYLPGLQVGASWRLK